MRKRRHEEREEGMLVPYIYNCVSFAVGQYGAVSTLDLSQDSTRLLCGHAKGLVRGVEGSGG